jgi:hypothetical protein
MPLNKRKIKFIKKNTAKSKKKKPSLFFKLLFSTLIIIFFAVFYFLVLISTKPKSIEYITNQVQKKLEENFGKNVNIEDTYLSFTKSGNIKITISQVKINYKASDEEKSKEFNIPIVETEFSLLNLLILNFQPSKVKIIKPDVYIENLDKIISNLDVSSTENDFAKNFFDRIKIGNIALENFEIDDARLITFFNKKQQDILIDQAKININQSSNEIKLSIETSLNLDKNNQNIQINSKCNIFKSSKLNCEFFFNNISPQIISSFNPKINFFDKILTKFSGSSFLTVEKNEIKKLKFNINANQGSFELKNFFSEKIEFKNFQAQGEYNADLNKFTINKLDTDLINNIKKINNDSIPHLSMLMTINDVMNDKRKFDFDINIQNVLMNDLSKFWPTPLSANGVRDWIINHITEGVVSSANAKFSTINSGNEADLIDINAQVNFYNSYLNYSDLFPAISKTSGVASFTKKNMEIIINNGNVLDSKISQARVIIDNFFAPIVKLKIFGKLSGKAEDGLKHISFKSKFASELNKYFNGNANSDFNIQIPLIDNLSLKDCLIDVKSKITNLRNDYINGSIDFVTFKKINSNIFDTDINLTNSQITADDFEITKDFNINSSLSFSTVVNDNKLFFKNIILSKNQNNSISNDNKNLKSTIYGDFYFNIDPFYITNLNIKNNNFGKNNYDISYLKPKQNSIARININAKYFDFSKILSNHKKSIELSKNFPVQISLFAHNLELMNKKNISNFILKADCKLPFCYSINSSGFFGKEFGFNIKNPQVKKDIFSNIEINIFDIGYLAEALGISELVSDGSAKINLKQKNIDDKKIFYGNLDLKSKVTVYENEKIKKLAKDPLYSQVKKDIFTENKTTFDFVKIEFEIIDKNLKIDSFVANNYKIGITSRGSINLGNNQINLKGMIVPGYIINSLFGIGNIPVIGNVISEILTGGKGGGIIAIRYEYYKKPFEKEGIFSTSKVSAFVPSTIQNLFY